MKFKKFFPVFLIIGLVIFLDVQVKAWVFNTIASVYLCLPEYPFGGISVFQNFIGIDFSIVHVANRGAAWGIFSSFSTPLLIFRTIVIFSMISYLLFFNKTHSNRFSFSLIIGGAIGNVLDHFFYGHVIDMFYFSLWGYSCPVFNLADSAIFFGILSLFLSSVISKRASSLKKTLNSDCDESTFSIEP